MRLHLVTLLLLLAVSSVAAAPAAAAAAPARDVTPPVARLDLKVGKGAFRFTDAEGHKDRPITVHYYRPEGVAPETARVLFVMHGTLRNGAEYRDLWIDQARKYGVLLFVPEFDRAQYPGGYYNRGFVRGQDDEVPQPENLWTFSTIERLFDHVRSGTGSREKLYYIYGHSAGGQFVHRLVLLLREARVARAVAANAGYYTVPTAAGDPDYPFSLKGTPGERAERRRAALGREMVVLLGEEDTDPKDPDLYHSPEADAQGMHRFARGRNFFRAAEREAKSSGATLRWTLRTVPGVGHSNEKMAPAAAAALFEGR